MNEQDRTNLTFMTRLAEYEKRYSVEKSASERPVPVRVEDVFDDFVRDFGGEKISDLLPNKNQMPLNADYIFAEANVIIELKTLEGIFAGSEGVKAVVQAFIDAGHSQEEAVAFLLGGADLVNRTRRLILQRMRRSIEKRISKARKQLHMSKRFFKKNDARCLLIFAIDQPPIFGQSTTILTLAKLFGDNFRDGGLDGIIYINPNVPTRPAFEGMEFGGWFPFYRDDDINAELSKFVDFLGNRWLTFYERKTGNQNPILQLTAPEEMLEILKGESLITPEVLKLRS